MRSNAKYAVMNFDRIVNPLKSRPGIGYIALTHEIKNDIFK